MPILSFRVEDTTIEKLDQIASSRDRSRSYVVGEAIRQYIDAEESIVKDIQEGIDDVEAGRTMSFAQFQKNMDQFIAQRKAAAKKNTRGKVTGKLPSKSKPAK